MSKSRKRLHTELQFGAKIGNDHAIRCMIHAAGIKRVSRWFEPNPPLDEMAEYHYSWAVNAILRDHGRAQIRVWFRKEEQRRVEKRPLAAA